MSIRVTDIVWDTDGDGVDLPTEMVVDTAAEGIEDPDTEIADWLSNKFGWCVNGFQYEAIALDQESGVPTLAR
jgi:hypothetical protein